MMSKAIDWSILKTIDYHWSSILVGLFVFQGEGTTLDAMSEHIDHGLHPHNECV